MSGMLSRSGRRPCSAMRRSWRSQYLQGRQSPVARHEARRARCRRPPESATNCHSRGQAGTLKRFKTKCRVPAGQECGMPRKYEDMRVGDVIRVLSRRGDRALALASSGHPRLLPRMPVMRRERRCRDRWTFRCSHPPDYSPTGGFRRSPRDGADAGRSARRLHRGFCDVGGLGWLSETTPCSPRLPLGRRLGPRCHVAAMVAVMYAS